MASIRSGQNQRRPRTRQGPGRRRKPGSLGNDGTPRILPLENGVRHHCASFLRRSCSAGVAYVTLARALGCVDQRTFIVMAKHGPVGHLLCAPRWPAPCSRGLHRAARQLRVPARFRGQLALGGACGAISCCGSRPSTSPATPRTCSSWSRKPAIARCWAPASAERATRRPGFGRLSAAGLAIIAGGDIALGSRALLGDAMSITAGLAIALFYVVARRRAPPSRWRPSWLDPGRVRADAAPVVLLTRAQLATPRAMGLAERPGGADHRPGTAS